MPSFSIWRKQDIFLSHLIDDIMPLDIHPATRKQATGFEANGISWSWTTPPCHIYASTGYAWTDTATAIISLMRLLKSLINSVVLRANILIINDFHQSLLFFVRSPPRSHQHGSDPATVLGEDSNLTWVIVGFEPTRASVALSLT